ncbi:uncharacterized protein K444DRAFT_319693 [Hyaloscypha bicolor E]|uniref:Uncharacterized protein n=1 Tax=Hyaloscypha bicolor E TaxID=1095630 RepID=A0A2J6TLD5_9HELO|nr:uncharacterized protein K444DRAFT_319693 [Hyaloscypha bicolor E]PMD63816.1 hypothetical protein K444DRAFT_319693 [Hyaloscypha bicolor E]
MFIWHPPHFVRIIETATRTEPATSVQPHQPAEIGVRTSVLDGNCGGNLVCSICLGLHLGSSSHGPAAALTSAIFTSTSAASSQLATKTSFFHPFPPGASLQRDIQISRRHSPHIRSETQLPLPCLFYGIIVSRHGNKLFPAFEAIFILPCTSPHLVFLIQ